MPRRAVFLDRDGILNEAVVRNGRPYPPTSLAEMTLLPGVEDACARLKKSGFLLIVVTNQPDIAKCKATIGEVEAINAALQARWGLDEVCVCPHDDPDNCACPKPKPGLLHNAARRWKIDLAKSFMIGDRWRDVEAGRAASCRTERRPAAADIVASSFAAVVPDIIAALERT